MVEAVIFVTVLCQITDLKLAGAQPFGYSFLGLLPGAFFLRLFMFFGVSFGSRLVPEGVLGLILEASEIMQNMGWE